MATTTRDPHLNTLPSAVSTASSADQYAHPENKRRFIRHPTEIPVEVSLVATAHNRLAKLQDISLGGFAFICTIAWQPGMLLKIRLPLVKPVFEALARVVWSRRRNSYYDVGVTFMDEEDAFRARLIEQLCQMEMYYQKQRGQGRQINAEEAALEWIGLYAEKFSTREQAGHSHAPLH